MQANQGWQEASQRIEKALESGALALDLSRLMLDTVPDRIADLVDLQELNLSHNNINADLNFLDRFRILRALDLTDNKITVIPDAIGQVTSLRSLNLTYNHITSLPD